jgi:hypothetical protein
MRFLNDTGAGKDFSRKVAKSQRLRDDIRLTTKSTKLTKWLQDETPDPSLQPRSGHAGDLNGTSGHRVRQWIKPHVHPLRVVRALRGESFPAYLYRRPEVASHIPGRKIKAKRAIKRRFTNRCVGPFHFGHSLWPLKLRDIALGGRI